MSQFLSDVGMAKFEPDSWAAQLVCQHFPPCSYEHISSPADTGVTVATYSPFPPPLKN